MLDLKEKFFEHLSIENNSPRTIENHGSTLRRAERFLSEKFALSIFDEGINQLEGNMLAEWVKDLDARKISDGSKVQYIQRMNRFLKWAFEMHYAESNLSMALPKIRAARDYGNQKGVNRDDALFAEEKDCRVYSDEAIVKMLEVAEANPKPLMAARDSAIIAMLVGTGLRASELMSLNIRNIRRAEGRCIRVWRKGGKKGTVAIAEFAMRYLERYIRMRGTLDDDDPLFVSSHGNRLDRESLWRIVSGIQKEAKVKTGVHNFRHTVLTKIAERNSSGVAAMIAGHSSDRITKQYYIHPGSADHVRAVDSMSISNLLREAM